MANIPLKSLLNEVAFASREVVAVRRKSHRFKTTAFGPKYRHLPPFRRVPEFNHLVSPSSPYREYLTVRRVHDLMDKILAFGGGIQALAGRRIQDGNPKVPNGQLLAIRRIRERTRLLRR